MYRAYTSKLTANSLQPTLQTYIASVGFGIQAFYKACIKSCVCFTFVFT